MKHKKFIMHIKKCNTLRTLFIGIIFTISASKLYAQNNNGIFFQAVARDNFSNPAKDRKIYVQSNIIQTSPSGTKLLTEEHQASTDAMGVFNISLGNGVRVGGTASSIAAIDWSKGPFYLNLKVAITPIGGNSNWDYTKEWIDMGTTSFGAVPFALYSASAAKVDDKLNIADTATMLKVYAKATSVQTLSTTVDTKLSAKDTLAMLAPYAKAAFLLDSAYINAQLKSKIALADSSKLYVTPTQLYAKTFDTTSLSNRINLKANTTEITSLTTSLANKLNIADSTTKYVTPAQLASYNFSSGVSIDTTNLSNRINLKANTTDITSLTNTLGIKLNIADSTKYVTPTQLTAKTFDTTNLSNRINLKANTTDITSLTNTLGIKLNIADSTKYVTPTQLTAKTFDTTNLSNRINLKASISYVDAQLANASIVDADANNKGKIQLAGDLTGTATVPTIANNAITTSKIIDGAITNAKIATGLDATKITGDIAGKASNVNGNVAIINGGTGAATASGARTNLGLVIGTDVQAPLNFTSPLIKNGTTISLDQATSSVDGYLSASDFTNFSNKIDASQKAANNGLATLGNDGKIPSVQIPAISFQSASVVNSQTSMLALSGLVVGSIAIRTDVNKNFVLSATPSSTLSNWVELATPNSVTSVNSYAGPNVVLTSDDVTEGSTNKYFTTSRARAVVSATSPLSYNASTGTMSMTVASAANNGYLSSADFTTFTNKQNTLTAGVDYIAPNLSINAATKTKITYDAKGLVLAGADATTADIAASTNKNYVTDVQASVLSNTSGINTGDQNIILTGDVVGRGTGSFTTTINSVGGVSSSTISNFDTRINSNTNSITTNTADILLRASIASPNFSGVPTAPTATAGTNTTQIATTAFVTASTLAAVPDATSSLKGKIKLVNDLGGTADAPTVNSVGGVSSSTISNFDTRINSTTASITANTTSINTLNTNVASNTSSITSLISSTVPYTGATAGVNLGAYDLTVNGLTIGVGAATISTTNNTAFGYNVLASNTTGTNNIANGNNALNKNTTGANNLAIGGGNLSNNNTGSNNTSLGFYALAGNSAGSYNSAIGGNALYNNTGGYNVAIGNKALYTNTTGNYNTAIGYMANVGSNNLENATAIGNSAVVTASNTIQLGNINVTNVKTSGTLTAGAVTYPITHGTSGQVLSTTGSGTLTWTTTAAPSDASTSAKGLIQLAGDLGGTASSPTVSSVGGVSASNIANFDTRISSATNSITTLNSSVTAATANNTISTIVKRDASGNFSAGTITANLTGNVTGNLSGNASTATNATTAGNITATSNNTLTSISTLSTVGTITTGTISLTTDIKTAGTLTAGAVTYPITHGTSGQVLSTTGSGTLTWTTTAAPSDASTSAKGIIQLAGDLAGTASLPTVNNVGGVSASTIGTINTTIAAATNSNTVNTIVKRDASGNFSAGTITANLTGNVTGNVTGSLTGNASTATTATTATTAGNITATSNSTLVTISTLSAVGTITSGTISVTTDIKTAGKLVAGTVTYPNTHGTSGQLLSTTGTGTLTWTSGSSVSIFTDEPSSITAGQTSFTLTNTPLSGRVWMYINGTRISKNAYSVSGTTVTYTPSFNNSYTLIVGDRIQFDYVY